MIQIQIPHVVEYVKNVYLIVFYSRTPLVFRIPGPDPRGRVYNYPAEGSLRMGPSFPTRVPLSTLLYGQKGY